ncbi:iron ABC transporter permease [Rhizobium sp. L1K21]|uniref:FecCD family ABC transporter permease n=1 Tax=Rhizobium sp. L1K21 TaxID=2954933 RepID=UPI002092B71D|nr:iron ABC transporter permease [Rhizobium sp. L1K21]MCO6187559.1 iron ABC transporter permease [Rhizobium sp. L1K21]
MRKAVPVFLAAMLILLCGFVANLSFGAGVWQFDAFFRAITQFDPTSYEQSVIVYQRMPRAMIAIYAGAMTAVSGMVLQGLIANPLAAPSTLGINAGAAFFVVAGALFFNLGLFAQGAAALAGGVCGFLTCFLVARLAGRVNDPRGLSLILSGALTSMFFAGLTSALLLADPGLRTQFLGWVSGNINHVYFERLGAFWWLGILCLTVLLAIVRPMTLIQLGPEKATSAGVNVRLIYVVALTATVIATASAVAVCGPIGFVGLVVPHMVRPLTGNHFARALPVSALFGASICLIADLIAREAFQPYVLHTGPLLDLLGGLLFVVIVKRFYLSNSVRAST